MRTTRAENKSVARYKLVDRSPRFLPIVLESQLVPGSFEHALDVLMDNEIDLSPLAARFCNDETGAPAYDPAVMLKIVLLAYSRGVVSSRAIERLCRENVLFMAISGDSAPRFTTIAAFVRELGEQAAGIFTAGAADLRPARLDRAPDVRDRRGKAPEQRRQAQERHPRRIALRGRANGAGGRDDARGPSRCGTDERSRS